MTSDGVVNDGGVGDRSPGETDYDNAVAAFLTTGMDIKRAIASANQKYPEEALKPGADDWDDMAARYHYLAQHKVILARLGIKEP